MIAKNRKRLAWSTTPGVEPEDIVARYRSALENVGGVLGIWAEVRGHTLRLWTLIEDDRDIERCVYDAELVVRGTWTDADIEFVVVGKDDWRPPEMAAATVIYQSSP